MKLPTKVRILSRTSRLAVAQVDEVLRELAAHGIELPGLDRAVTESFGDKHKDLSLLDGQDADFFTREIDHAILSGGADLGIHSAKDLPFPLTKGLKIFALTGPADQRDALVCRAGVTSPGAADGVVTAGTATGFATLDTLPSGARIGTSSPARKAFVRNIREDLETLSIRGTIEERLSQLDSGQFDAVIVAACALDRLGLSYRINSYLDAETHPLQGYLAIVGRPEDRELCDLFSAIDVRRTWARVSIAGAGPGDPELVTVKTQNLIARADVVFHDALSSPRLLENTGAELVFVGKRRGKHEMSQDEINERLYRSALAGKKTLRLKGGDPLLFGRGSEEAIYLRERLVDVELVPGISAAFAAANYAGIPLTERGVSTGVAFMTGWPAESVRVPETDTAVYYMGGGSLKHIARKHIESGVSPDTPVALVAHASLPGQQVWHSDLATLSGDETEYPTPVLVFIGNTTRSRDSLAWWDEMPLVWYTGTEADRYSARRQAEGRPCRLLHLPLIHIEFDDEADELSRAIDELGTFDWIFFTSRWAVSAFFRALGKRRLDTRALALRKIAAVGSGTAAALAERGVLPDLVPGLESARGLLSAFDGQIAPGKMEGLRCLLPSSDQALPTLADGLRSRGCHVFTVVAYRNTAVSDAVYPETPVDEIVFTSPSTVRAFRSLFGDPAARGARLVSIGESTAKELAGPVNH